MDQEPSGHEADAWSDVREGAIRKFCFVQVDLAGHSEIARSSATRDAEATFGNFLEYIQAHVHAHGGHTWGLAGDGGLFAFHDSDVTTMVEQAVASALDIVDHLDEFNSTKSQVEQQVRARVAVHYGDARYLEETGRIQSDDINFVAHLEKGRTESDSVSISGSVQRELKEEMQTRFRDNGTFEDHRVYTSSLPSTRARFRRKKGGQERRATTGALVAMVVLLIAVGVGWWWTSRRVPAIGPEKIERLAVLPFANLMNDPDQEYFVDGMHDALLTELARIKGVTVISRQSVIRYKGSEKSLPEIASELQAHALIEGSVMRVDDDVRFNVQLIDAAADRHLWAEAFDRKLENVLALHMDVARAIAREVKITLTPEDEVRLAGSRKVNPETYEAYLKGMYYVNRDEYERGLAYLHQAIDNDPADPLAYAGLALGYVSIGHSIEAIPDALPRARAAAETAIKLDSTLAEAHLALAMVKFYYEWDWEGAEREFLRADELNPNLAWNHFHYSWWLYMFGRLDEAIQEHTRAQELDPLTPIHTSLLAWLYVSTERYDEAITEAKTALELDPNHGYAWFVIGWAYLEQGMYEEAIAAHENLGPRWNAFRGRTYAMAGRMAEAQKLLEELESQRPTPWNAYGLAVLHTALGNKDEAFRWLAYEPHHAWVPGVRVEAWFEPLRDDPRYKDALRRMKLPE